MIIILHKKSAFFCNFVLTPTRKLSLLKQYTYASKSSHYTLSENAMVCSGLSRRPFAIKISKDADSSEIRRNSLTSILNMPETVNHTIINNSIF